MSRLGLIDICEQAALDDGVNLLVVVDQFEELFRYRQVSGAGPRAEDAAAFVNLLLEVKAHPAVADLRRPHDALGLPGRLHAVPRSRRGDQRRTVPGAAADPRRTARRHRKAGPALAARRYLPSC